MVHDNRNANKGLPVISSPYREMMIEATYLITECDDKYGGIETNINKQLSITDH